VVGVVGAKVRSEQVHTLRLVPSRTSSVAITLCLAAGLLLTLTGTGLAVSGLGSSGAAVVAQYPDARDLASSGSASRSNVSNLGDIVNGEREARRNPKTAASHRADASRVERRVVAELPSSGALAASQSGSIPLLISGIAVLSVGGILRWRRDGVPQGEELPGGGAGPS
jgi:hypothetical protein